MCLFFSTQVLHHCFLENLLGSCSNYAMQCSKLQAMIIVIAAIINKIIIVIVVVNKTAHVPRHQQ